MSADASNMSGVVISSTFEINDQGTSGDETSLGVSVGDGMIHYVLLTSDETGRTALESRVFDVDPTDGLDPVGRVNAGIDLMLDAARAADLRVGPIGVAARTATQRRRLGSGGSGTRRQIQLSSDEEAVAEFLTRTGQIDRFSSVVVADCGDTGISFYTLDPSAGRIGTIERSTVFSGRQIDETLADHVAAESDEADRGTRTRRQRAALVSACRTAKEEVAESAPSTALAGVSLTAAAVEKAAAPLVEGAGEALARFVDDARSHGLTPDAVVLVGGVANLSIARQIADHADLEVLTPATPELAAATGAAMLARNSGAARLTLIGGRRVRSLSAVPVAVVAGIIGAVAMAAVAVGATLTTGPAAPPSTMHTADAQALATTSDSFGTSTSTRAPTRGPRSSAPQPTTPLTGHEQFPGWATTELPLTTPTSTLTLVPNTTTPPTTPSGEVPSGPSLSPFPTLPIPPGLIPPELIPSVPTTPTSPSTTPTGDTPNVIPSQPSSRQTEVPPHSATEQAPAVTTTTTPAG
ncbi:molecular chaperone [Gordonia sp. DT30]|uniref:Hsp70 family protein n=1 Tax=Gordonia sp. DT30 TaxID=3416546 RepID=UPI003CFBB4CB